MGSMKDGGISGGLSNLVNAVSVTELSVVLTKEMNMIPVNLRPDSNVILMSNPDSQTEQDLHPVSVPESRVSGGIEKEPKHKNIGSMAIGAFGTVMAYTFGPVIGDLLKATPIYKRLYSWFGEVDLSPMTDLLVAVWQFIRAAGSAG
jgi:hypothetical protein